MQREILTYRFVVERNVKIMPLRENLLMAAFNQKCISVPFCSRPMNRLSWKDSRSPVSSQESECESHNNNIEHLVNKRNRTADDFYPDVRFRGLR